MNKLFLLNICIAVLWLSCVRVEQNENNTALIAEVGRYKLTEEMVLQWLPEGLDSLDRAAFIANYKQQWVRQKLLVSKAESTLTVDEMEMSRKMEEYRENLLIYRLEQKYISEHLDTLVPVNLSKSYYEKHMDKFKLPTAIVKAVVVQVPTYASEPEEIKRLLMSKDTNDFLSLESYCFRYATRYDDFEDEWIPFHMVERFFKDDFQQPKRFFLRNRYYEQKDSLNFRCVYLKQFMDAGAFAPYEYSRKRVENWILNERKRNLLRELDSLTYKEAMHDDRIK
ncbi:hypothetical protein K5X82_15375 [Halosquirtibacter xylanolyticus]|uniref:hypothetical protein n=1 Tax=Halosquirtibacter xylanolyticus TaxID=3374599 RepID=UPI003747B828|nr:hypothetical protein K5X82_15375 [Prolixibacteraceae bacterium]